MVHLKTATLKITLHIKKVKEKDVFKKNTLNIQKAKSKMTDINPTIPITLSVKLDLKQDPSIDLQRRHNLDAKIQTVKVQKTQNKKTTTIKELRWLH